MLASAIPTRFQLAWAKNAAGAYIRTVPVNSQIGIQDGAASFSDGFVPDNFTQIVAGGVPPFGQDFNGLLNAITAWNQWDQAGGPIPYDATFATAVGGYPKGAVLDSAIVIGAQWYSTADNNLTNPDDPSTSVGWQRAGLPVGMPVPFLTATLPPGFVIMNTNTIGSAASGAAFADASAIFLFAFNWPNSVLAIFDSSGTPTTRGANALADFAANKRLTTPGMRGTALVGCDTMAGSVTTNLAGVPIGAGNATTPGSVVGQNLHQLTTAELAAHLHANVPVDPHHFHGGIPTDSGTQANSPPGGHIFNGTAGNTSSAATGITITNANAGGDGAHNTVQQSMLVYWGQKL